MEDKLNLVLEALEEWNECDDSYDSWYEKYDEDMDGWVEGKLKEIEIEYPESKFKWDITHAFDSPGLDVYVYSFVYLKNGEIIQENIEVSSH